MEPIQINQVDIEQVQLSMNDAFRAFMLMSLIEDDDNTEPIYIGVVENGIQYCIEFNKGDLIGVTEVMPSSKPFLANIHCKGFVANDKKFSFEVALAVAQTLNAETAKAFFMDNHKHLGNETLDQAIQAYAFEYFVKCNQAYLRVKYGPSEDTRWVWFQYFAANIDVDEDADPHVLYRLLSADEQDEDELNLEQNRNFIDVMFDETFDSAYFEANIGYGAVPYTSAASKLFASKVELNEAKSRFEYEMREFLDRWD